MRRGSILIVTCWILAILTLFAVGIGFRTSLEIRLTGYSLSRLKALYIAKAAINRAIIEKWKEYAEGKSLEIDAFSERWANDEKGFKDIGFGDGRFTLGWLTHELDRGENRITLYGLQDEASRININSDKAMPVLRDLLVYMGLGLKDAQDIVSAVTDWRDQDDIPKAPGSAENAYYRSLDAPYSPSNREFAAPEEILLIKGVARELYYGGDIDKDGAVSANEKGIKDFITVYTDGAININTAPQEVLNCLFGIGYPELAAKVADYRSGIDGKAGTDDDRWFTKGVVIIIERGERGLGEVKNLNDENWYGNIFGITDGEYKRMKELAGQGLLVASSDFYRADVTASVNKIKKRIRAVLRFIKPAVRTAGFTKEIPPPEVEYLCWREEI